MKLINKKIITSALLTLIYLSNNYSIKKKLTISDFKSEIHTIPSTISPKSTYALHKYSLKNQKLQIMVIYFNLELISYPSIIYPIFFFHVKKDNSIKRLDVQLENSLYQIQIEETNPTGETNFKIFEIQKSGSPYALKKCSSPILQKTIKAASELWTSEQARTYSSLNRLVTQLNTAIIPWLPYKFI